MTQLRLMGLDLAPSNWGVSGRIGVRKAEALAVAALLGRGLSEDGAWKKTPAQVVS